jgi:putative transposase
MAVNRQGPTGARGQEVALRSDHGGQPPALAVMQACHTLGIHQALTSANNPTGHADPARVMRTIKDEGLWLQEWTSPFALIRALDIWIADDNAHDLHSALGYQSPSAVLTKYLCK